MWLEEVLSAKRYVKMLFEVPAFAVSGESEERNERRMKERNKGL